MTKHSFYLLLSVITFFLISCSNDNSESQNKGAKHAKYQTVTAMLDSSGDFSSDNGTFKILSESPLHIQISEITLDARPDEQIKQETLKNIVYIAYQTFATTEIESLSITSVPLMFDTEKQELIGYNDNFKTTLTIDRKKAKMVMEQFVGLTDFDDLLGMDTGEGLYFPNSPSPKFDKLKSIDTIENVINALRT
jgi:hypothetical protein